MLYVAIMDSRLNKKYQALIVRHHNCIANGTNQLTLFIIDALIKAFSSLPQTLSPLSQPLTTSIHRGTNVSQGMLRRA